MKRKYSHGSLSPCKHERGHSLYLYSIYILLFTFCFIHKIESIRKFFDQFVVCVCVCAHAGAYANVVEFVHLGDNVVDSV